MKPTTVTKNDFEAIPTNSTEESFKTGNFTKPYSIQNFSVPEPMTQEIEPPAYIWDKIASVLDAQDSMKVEKQTVVAPEPTPPPASADKKKYVWYAAAAMLIGAILLSVI